MPGWKYDIVLGWMSDEDLEEISGFPTPTQEQAEGVIRDWECNYAGQNIQNLDNLAWAKGVAKLYIKCMQTYPEKFI